MIFQVAFYLPIVTFDELPLIVMGLAVLTGGVLTMVLLPETVGTNLAETVEDVENLKKNKQPCIDYILKSICRYSGTSV